MSKSTVKISKRVETMFATAAGLFQSGRFRATIYCLKNRVYILGADNTVLIRYRLEEGDRPFKTPVSFAASEYDSDKLEEQDGRVVFVRKEGDMVRRTSCRTTEMTPAAVAAIFKEFGKPSGSKIVLSNALVGLLEEGLSHVEFSGRDGRLRIVQRNIYQGTHIEITLESGDDSFGLEADAVQGEMEDFGPIGMRTADLMALFAFERSLVFRFSSDDVMYINSGGGKTDADGRMRAVVAQCKYDELAMEPKQKGGQSGRKVKKERAREQEAD